MNLATERSDSQGECGALTTSIIPIASIARVVASAIHTLI